MHRPLLLVLPLGFVLLLAQPPRRLGEGEPVAFQGTLADARQLSGIGRAAGFLVVVADEADRVTLLKDRGRGYEVAGVIQLPNPAGGEIDLEAVAVAGEWVHVLGSHSSKRPKLKENGTQADVAKRMERVEPEASRFQLFRFRLTPEGKAEDLTVASLKKLLDAHPLLARFRSIPGKENGLDLEGLAAKDGLLFAGCRSPVLRANWVPVLRFAFTPGPIGSAETLFVNLGGRGIRDLAAVSDGILILAGPPADGPGNFQLFHWNGHSCLPGQPAAGQPPGTLRPLGELTPPKDARPEGLLVLAEREKEYELLLLFDGLENGGPRRLHVEK